MRKLILLLLLATQAFAAKTLTSSYPFTDAQGNPISNGYLIFNLSGGAEVVAGGQVVPVPPIQINLGAGGTVLAGQSIMANDELFPTGTWYMVRVFNSNKVLVRGPEKWILSGAGPIDLSLMIDTAIPDPGLGSPVLQNPAAPQTITGQSLTLSSTAPLTVQGTAAFQGAVTFSAAMSPSTVGGTDVGTSALPFANVWIGNAATNNIGLTGTATAARVATLPDNTGTIAELNLAQTWSANQSFASGTLLPSAAGGTDVGSASLPFGSLWVGGAATNNLKLTGTATAARVVTFPDASITVPGTVIQDCGTTTTCSATNISTSAKVVKGNVALSSGTPSTATVTGFSPAFTSSSSFVCTATNATAQADSVKVVNASASSITITGPNTVTDTVNYICVGN